MSDPQARADYDFQRRHQENRFYEDGRRAYIGSEEEADDLKEFYIEEKGNITNVLFLKFRENCDIQRIVTFYDRLIEKGALPRYGKYTETKKSIVKKTCRGPQEAPRQPYKSVFKRRKAPSSSEDNESSEDELSAPHERGGMSHRLEELSDPDNSQTNLKRVLTSSSGRERNFKDYVKDDAMLQDEIKTEEEKTRLFFNSDGM